ncbi:hypothetical protein TL16_g00391 [Triparma laevis f. inornata]|uniref:JmjC domain-containing protein n=1 Tax=Triparma laevis f. inornata TaxID=1714386 RepID=A0A9W6ZAT6_9STRA|nr:hypothetical protein TL16_g00391 [Triparma laevis f. inornata]
MKSSLEISLNPQDHRQIEEYIEQQVASLRSEVYMELEATIAELNSAMYDAFANSQNQETVNPNTGTVRENKKVKAALRELEDNLETVQTELKRQTNASKLAKTRQITLRRSKLYYGSNFSAAEHKKRFSFLRWFLTLASGGPGPFLILLAVVLDSAAWYHIAVAAWPIEMLYVLLHFIITIERTSVHPYREEKIHFVLWYACHWASVVFYSVYNPSVANWLPTLGLMAVTSTPLYYMLKQIRAAVQQYHIVEEDSGKYVDEVFLLLIGVLLPQLYLFFEIVSCYNADSGEAESGEEPWAENIVRINANLCLIVHLMELALFDIACIGTGITSIRDIMCFTIPPFLQISQVLLIIAGLVALYFQGAKESDGSLSETMRLILWYSFGISTTVANLILAFKLPLKEIIKRRKRKLLVTGRTAREKAFELGDEKNQGNSELPKQLGVQVTAYEREISKPGAGGVRSNQGSALCQIPDFFQELAGSKNTSTSAESRSLVNKPTGSKNSLARPGLTLNTWGKMGLSRSTALLALLLAILYLPLAELWAKRSNRPLLQVDRVSEADLPYEDFLEKYLKPGLPVVIMHDGPDSPFTQMEGEGDALLKNILKECGNQRVDLLSPTIKTVSRQMHPVVMSILSIFLLIFQGKTVPQWLEERTYRRIDAMQNISGSDVEYEESWFMNAAAFFVPSVFHRLMLLLSRPAYLADLSRDVVCESVLGKFKQTEEDAHPFLRKTQYELKTQKLLASSSSSKLGEWPTLDKILRHDSTDKFFWGGPGASSYPLHRDVQDADTFFTVFTGCKDFVMVDPSQREHLTSLDLPTLHVWKDDLFRDGRPVDLERAWGAVVYPGETLYMPGDFLHEVRAKCPNTSNICRRPWRASATRDISEDSIKLYNEFTYDELVKRSWLYATIDYIDNIMYPKAKYDVNSMSGNTQQLGTH